ncbi:hypothetical protein FIBSPDRAFT_932176 [Athelia psychrophila]|uniref:G domain-containing protein n=1 Tax=Athelia psychrophila TaxID=1759441 RepID=A0A166J3H5_9AGAM|nr:hypothetical protein FIBSPDRAFT_932176 [Fibularhizoctonia sp. CBS 109695]
MNEGNATSTMINAINAGVFAQVAAAASESDWQKFGNVLGVDDSSLDTPKTSSSPTLNSSDPRTDMRANIILFGESGVGKSSLVNMITGKDSKDGKNYAQTSEDATGCTFESTPYDVDLPDFPALRIWDTAGLNEAETGAVNFKQAVSNIYKLTRIMDGGVHLLVYCVRHRITDHMVQNYKMFRAFCGGEVPIVLVITALENCLDRSMWWTNNAKAFVNAGIEVIDHACVATVRQEGREEEFMQWTVAVRRMIDTRCLKDPWKMEKDGWFVMAVTKLVELLFNGPSNMSRELYKGLRKGGVSKEDARRVAREYDASLPKVFARSKRNVVMG